MVLYGGIVHNEVLNPEGRRGGLWMQGQGFMRLTDTAVQVSRTITGRMGEKVPSWVRFKESAAPMETFSRSSTMPKDTQAQSFKERARECASWMKSFDCSWCWSTSFSKEYVSLARENLECSKHEFKKLASWMKRGLNKGFEFRMKGFSASSSTRWPNAYQSSAYEMEFSMLQAATDNFSKANLLGEGGSATVYRAKLDGGVLVAVKVMEAQMEGDVRHPVTDFQAEVDLMRSVRHPNLVSLLGYCNQGHRCFLVYELMQNGSLEDQLYGPKRGTGISWCARTKIALESARGLEYLHAHCDPPVVHRDFKASNILLDANLNAKISDFGLATPLERLTHEESLQLVGTIGYVAPEFFSSGALTEKSDVYAFGVTLLELLTGRKPIDPSLPPEQQSLVKWAVPQLTDRSKLPKMVDSHLHEDMNLKHLYQVAAIAALCVEKEPSYRPLIADVVQSLLPLVPQELGGALRSDSSNRSSSFSMRHQLPEGLRCESFNFADNPADYDFPADSSIDCSFGANA